MQGQLTLARKEAEEQAGRVEVLTEHGQKSSAKIAELEQALKEAIARGVNVRVILDHKSSKGVPKSTTADALAAIEANAFPVEHLVFRTNPASAISHNKFIVFVRDGMPVSLWTGSTNFTPGGIYGQLNAAHWIKDPGNRVYLC